VIEMIFKSHGHW